MCDVAAVLKNSSCCFPLAAAKQTEDVHKACSKQHRCSPAVYRYVATDDMHGGTTHTTAAGIAAAEARHKRQLLL
jgi:hypothetical protein